MPKTFYTERDIEDLARAGQSSLVLDDDTVLTELAWEKAKRLGFTLVQPYQTPPSAPLRPYLSQTPASAPAAAPASSDGRLELIRVRVKSAVREKLGAQVDEAMLDQIIDRVAAQLGLR